MTDKKKNGWIKFVPSLDLPKERVSIAYDTHDERGVRYAYGYFQFYNGTCGCFWKDGNEQPKVVKAEDIKYWMPIPSLDAQEYPVSEDLEEEIQRYLRDVHDRDTTVSDVARHFANWQKQQMEAYRIKHCKSLTNEQAELESNFVSSHVEKNNRIPTFIDAIEYGIEYGKQQMMAKAVDAQCFGFQGAALFSFRLPADKYLVGSEVKVIVIKED